MSDSSSSPTPPSERTTITLIRHGESEVTVDRVIGGKRTCRGLSPLGRQQAKRLRDRLAAEGVASVDAVISSDFQRAIETADIIRPAFGEAGAPHAVDAWADLGEHDPGPEVDGMSFDDYVERYGSPDWDGDVDAELFPGGETLRDFHERVARGVERLRDEFVGRNVMVVCHGGVVDAVFRILLGLPMTGGFELHTLNTAMTTFSEPIDVADGSARWRLGRYNDAAHLVGLPDATPRRS